MARSQGGEPQWFLQPQVDEQYFLIENSADNCKTNFEWTKWWETAPIGNDQPAKESTDNASASTMPLPFYIDPNSFPIASPASTNTSESVSFDTQPERVDEDESAIRAKKRKLQNREAQRKCRDRRREQFLNLREQLQISMAENKKLQGQYISLQNEFHRMKMENEVYYEILQNFWTSSMVLDVGMCGRSADLPDCNTDHGRS